MGDWTPPEQRFSNLGRRLVSALVLIPAGLSFVWFGGWWLAIGCAIFAGAMAWEWWRMSGTGDRYGLPLVAGLVCLSLPLQQMGVSVGMCVAGGAFFFAISPRKGAARFTAPLGLVYVVCMAGSLWLLREGPWDGRAATLYFMSFVWASDAAAYFTGRGLGGPRLLPEESPNKTWAGAIGAIVICAVCGVAAADVEGVEAFAWIFAAVAISIVAQMGDLFESGLKRRFHVKDSSGLLPGHGGVLDRVDGLGAVAIAAVISLHFGQSIAVGLGLY